MRELLRHRDFRLLLAGQTLSMFGDRTLLLVYGIWAKTLTGSNAIAGLTVLAMAAPGLLGPFAGVLVDRLPRRAVMIGLNMAKAAVGLHPVVRRRPTPAVAAVRGRPLVRVQQRHVQRREVGLEQAMLPVDHIGPANGVLATVRQALRLIGPIIGAGLFTTVGGIATLLQRSTPKAIMGRVAAGYDTIGTVPTTISIAIGACWSAPGPTEPSSPSAQPGAPSRRS